MFSRERFRLSRAYGSDRDSAMAFVSFIRAVSVARHARGAESTSNVPAAQRAVSGRHPAMSGLNVSPVHGRHCICNRCSLVSTEQARQAS